MVDKVTQKIIEKRREEQYWVKLCRYSYNVIIITFLQSVVLPPGLVYSVSFVYSMNCNTSSIVIFPFFEFIELDFDISYSRAL